MATAIGLVDLFPLEDFAVGSASTVALDSGTDRAGAVFVAPKTANIVTVKFAVDAKAGTGGTVLVQLTAVDATGNPDTATVYASESVATSAVGEYEVTLGTPYGVTAGTVYGVDLTNTDGTPGTNYPTVIVAFSTGPTVGVSIARDLPYGLTNTGSWSKVSSGVPAICPCYASNEKVLGFCQAKSTTLEDFNSGSAADERALAFTVPMTMTCVGFKVLMRVSSTTADFEAVFYSGATATHTLAVDGDMATTATGFAVFHFPTAVTLSTGTTYRIAIKPTTANNVRTYHTIYGTTASRDEDFPLAPYHSYRADAGAWTDTNSAPSVKLMVATPIISEIDTASGGIIGRIRSV